MRGYLTIGPAAARGSYSISVRRRSAGSSRSGPGVQETGCGTWVTKAKGGHSIPNFGLAFDIVVLDAVHKDGWDDDHPGWAASRGNGGKARANV